MTYISRGERVGGMARATCLCLLCAAANSAPASFSLQQVLDYPFPNQLTAAPKNDLLAWVERTRGIRNVWFAAAPAFQPRALTSYTQGNGEGQELSSLSFSTDGRYLVFVSGGDPGENWSAPTPPDPTSGTTMPRVQVWSIALEDGTTKALGEGNAPIIAPDSARVAFIHAGAVWVAPLDGSSKAELLFFDRGHDRNLQWSPDGKALAFVSDRDDHTFIGIYRNGHTAIEFVAPSTTLDDTPAWSPDGARIAFIRQPGTGGSPQPILKLTPSPWSIWVANVSARTATQIWHSPDTLRGSYPDAVGGPNLHWLAADRLIYLSGEDNWPHLYSIPAAGGSPRLLTPGSYMVEDVAVSSDHQRVIYSANNGSTAGDLARRHLYLITADGSGPASVTSGDVSQWSPVLGNDGRTLAFIQAGPRLPPLVSRGDLTTRKWQTLNREHLPAAFPGDSLIVPELVSFEAEDGLTVHGELFIPRDGAKRKPAVLFVHGGPPRQMLLGWHYFPFYSTAYAMNQFLASQGFVVLSVDYRLSIGYGQDFHWPEHWGPTGASEYKDVLAAAQFLKRNPHVDPERVGIWGSSYGGYLTALALARNSDIFKAGVDLNGVHDWSYDMELNFPPGKPRYEQGDRAEAIRIAWESSPDAAIKTWRSPVLIVQGDDDRNVYFHHMIDLVNRLQEAHVPFEQLVLPNEPHVFQLQTSLLAWGNAMAEFFQRQLGPQNSSTSRGP